MPTFKQAFAAARKAKGPGSTFTWNGKSYSTNTAEDAPRKKPRAQSAPPRRPTAPVKSKRPVQRVVGEIRQMAKKSAAAQASKAEKRAAPSKPRAKANARTVKPIKQKLRYGG